MKKGKFTKIVLILLVLSLVFFSKSFIYSPEIIKMPYNYLGIILILTGLFSIYLAGKKFKEVGNQYDLKSDSKQLIKSGIYSYSRNPMYLGALMFLIGAAVFLRSLITFIYPLIFFAACNYMISLEEKNLEKVYGTKYLKYKKKVRRWL